MRSFRISLMERQGVKREWRKSGPEQAGEKMESRKNIGGINFQKGKTTSFFETRGGKT